MTKRFFPLLILVIVLFSGCPDKADVSQYIYFKNNSNNDVFVYKKQHFSESSFQDTLLPIDKHGNIVESKSNLGSYINLDDYGYQIFILSLDTINKYTWEDIRKNNLVLKRFDLTQSDFERLNWRVEYP